MIPSLHASLLASQRRQRTAAFGGDGKVILEARTPTAPKTIATAFAKGPAVERVLFETGLMAPTLFHSLTALGLPVVFEQFNRGLYAQATVVMNERETNS